MPVDASTSSLPCNANGQFNDNMFFHSSNGAAASPIVLLTTTSFTIYEEDSRHNGATRPFGAVPLKIAVHAHFKNALLFVFL
jgi:hypothetical protein